jgi:hypothetical protein
MKMNPQILKAIQLSRIDAKNDTMLSMAHYANVDPGGGNMGVIKQKTMVHYGLHLKRRLDELLTCLELTQQEQDYISSIAASENEHFQQVNDSAKDEAGKDSK